MSTSPPPQTRVRLRAWEEGALRDPKVRDMVVANARAIAERTGVELLSIEIDEQGVSAIVQGDRLIAMGLVAELRRLTGAWYTRHHPGRHLWIEPDPDRDAHAGDPPEWSPEGEE